MITASTDDFVLSRTEFYFERREGRTWEATIKAMGILRDHGAGFIEGARNLILQYKAGAPRQREQAACQGKASGCGTKRRIQCLCVERAPESQDLGAVDGDFCFCTECDVSKPKLTAFHKSHGQKRPIQPFPSALSLRNSAHLQGIVPSTYTSSLLALGHLCQHLPLPVGLADFRAARQEVQCPVLSHGP